MNLQRDPVTQSVISAEEQERDKRNWEARTTEFVGRCNPGDALALCQALYQFLDQESRGQLGRRPTMPLCDHAPDSYLADHALLTSAIVYCLGHDQSDVHLLRLAALSHELPDTTQRTLVEKLKGDDGVMRAFLNDSWQRLRDQGKRLAAAFETENSLARFTDEQPENLDERYKLLWQAHLAAAARLHNTVFDDAGNNPVKTIATSADFAQHPLQRYNGSVGLVYGGVTKVKQYVFESARLPEIRGASVLLDRINQVDLPALWGWLPPPLVEEEFLGPADRGRGERTQRAQVARALQVRAQFEARYQIKSPLAPECVIYAGGGNILALAPAALTDMLADAIEWIYTEQTLSANCAAVGRAFDLLELQYGRQPTVFWWEEYQAAQQNPMSKALLDGYYSYTEELQPVSAEGIFYARKTFGELATLLAVDFYQRRAGQGQEAVAATVTGRQVRAIPHFELPPFAVKCYSCDKRPAVITVGDPNDVAEGQSLKVFCQACARKRVTGQQAKQEQSSREWFVDPFGWTPQGVIAWEQEYMRHLLRARQGATDADILDLVQAYYGGLAQTMKRVLKRLETKERARYGIERLSAEAQQALVLGIAATEHSGDPIRLLVEIEALHEQGHDLLRPATMLSEIGAASKPDGFIGLIYADGNNVGAQVARIATPAAYRQFAVRLEQANRAAVFAALAQHLQPHFLAQATDPEQRERSQLWVHPFEIVTIGGDDVLLFVPGDQALAVVATMSETLEALLGRQLGAEVAPPRYAFQRYQPHERTGGGWLQPVQEMAPYVTGISASSGVVVAQAHTPVFFLVDLAQELQKTAKKMRKVLGTKAPALRSGQGLPRLEDALHNGLLRQMAWDNKRRGGTVDFLVLKAVEMITSSVEDFRTRALQRQQPGNPGGAEIHYLTARPYTLPELRGLMALAQALTAVKFPASQQYTVERNLTQGRLPATVNYLYFYSRLRDERYRRALDQYFHYGWGTQEERLLTAPWRLLAPAVEMADPHGRQVEKQGTVDETVAWETIWHDLLEIAEFIGVVEEESDAILAD